MAGGTPEVDLETEKRWFVVTAAVHGHTLDRVDKVSSSYWSGQCQTCRHDFTSVYRRRAGFFVCGSRKT